MKVAILFLAVIGLASTAVITPGRGWPHGRNVAVQQKDLRSLDDLLKQFESFIPIDKIIEIVTRYMENDPDVQKAWAFLQSDTFYALTDKVEKMQEYQDFLKYLYDSGLDIYTYENIIREILGLPPIEHNFRHSWVRESGIIKMINEILGVLPVDKIKDWFINVCLPDPDFQNLIQRILSPDFQKLVEAVTSTPEYQELLNVLREQGIDVEAIEKAIDDFLNSLGGKSYNLGTKLRPRSLTSLLDELKDIIPVDGIIKIVIPYVLSDPDVKSVIAFAQSEDFRNLMIKMSGVPELKEFLNWVVDHGIDIYGYINAIFDFLGIPHITPASLPMFRHPSTQSGLSKMIDEIIAILPMEEIVKWYHTSCENDPDFLGLMEQLKSDSFKVVVETMIHDPLFQVMRNGLSALDIDVVTIDTFLHETFGW